MAAAELLDERGLGGIEREWDELAAECARPGSIPDLLMPWWRHLAPPGARARVVAVREGGRLVGLAPFLVHDGPLGRPAARLFGTPSLPATILAAPGHEAAVWPLVARTLGRSEPRPAMVSLERVDGDAAWPRALARAWPAAAGARLLWEFRIPGRALSMQAGGFDAWMAGRSHKGRDVRRTARRLHNRGGTIVRADSREDIERALEAFGRLHEQRWGNRSRLWRPNALAMLREAGERMRGTGRLRLYALEVEGRVVATLIVFAAGGEAMAWNGAWQPDWGHLRPMMALIYRAIDDCFALGDRRLDFGEGEEEYKLRLTDARDPVAWATLLPRGASYPLMRAATAPRRLRGRARMAARRLPAGLQDRLRRARRRIRGESAAVSDGGGEAAP